MNETVYPGREDDLGYDWSCGLMISGEPEVGDNPPATVEAAPGGFCWYEQDSGDELGEEVLVWATMEEVAVG